MRAVFEKMGNMTDSSTGKPLFNATAWKKANNVLKEILEGNAADLPGVEYYTQRLDSKGQPKVDRHGRALLDCERGTNRTEAAHKQIVTTFGTWSAGVHMSDCLMREWRHRFNQHVSERRRLGFPKLGFVDTWMIDSLQLLVEANHGGTLLYPEWSNASDFAKTPESFGTVPLHSEELGVAIATIGIDMSKVKLTADQQYLCTAMQTKLPIFPVYGKAEKVAFSLLACKHQSSTSDVIDFEQMAIEWCAKVDGVEIFPKLPVYLRKYHTAWQRSQRIKDALAEQEETLSSLRVQASALAASTSPGGQQTDSAAPRTPAAPVIQLPRPLPKPIVRAIAVPLLVDGRQHFVGGVPIGPSVPGPSAAQSKRRRGADTSGQRQPRRCSRCVDREAEGYSRRGDPTRCEGRNTRVRVLDGKQGRQRCEFWDDTDSDEEDAEL